MAVPLVGGVIEVKVGIGGELGHITGAVAPVLHRKCGKVCGNRSRNARESASFLRFDRFALLWCEDARTCRERDCRLYLFRRTTSAHPLRGRAGPPRHLSDESGRNIHCSSLLISCTSSSPINCRPLRSAS